VDLRVLAAVGVSARGFASPILASIVTYGLAALVESARPALRGGVGGVSESEQLMIDRGTPAVEAVDERAARRSLRAQVTRLERELSQVVAGGFPHIPANAARDSATESFAGPRLLTLAQLERQRDTLAGRVQDVRALARKRAEHERRSHELLEQMKLEPGRYKFVRLPVSDLGQGGCGVWEVRPRLGLIGMLAGWWQLTLSSGCPLPRGSRSTRGPARQT
jgi:hypothetical protein